MPNKNGKINIILSLYTYINSGILIILLLFVTGTIETNYSLRDKVGGLFLSKWLLMISSLLKLAQVVAEQTVVPMIKTHCRIVNSQHAPPKLIITCTPVCLSLSIMH